MKSSLIRTAHAININGKAALEVTRSKLLPPIPLYRHLLRTHRQLPLEMRSLGDDYLKAEFNRHKQADNPVHIMGFLLEWNQYLDQLRFQFGHSSPDNFRGKRMDDTLFEKVRNSLGGKKNCLKLESTDVQ
jgi:Complex1_LYR-like